MPDYKTNFPGQPPRCLIVTIMAFLLFLQGGLIGYLSWSTSPNRTEIGHVGAMVYFWHTGKFDVFHVNPPLTRFIAGIPVDLFCNPKYDWKSYSPRPQDRSEWALGNAFVAANELDDLRVYVLIARLACLPLILLGGYFGYKFASELYGEWSGIVFLILWTFSPLILGWGATICPDVAAASIGIVGLYTFWHWLKKPTWGKAIIAGICLGLMPLTKMTWIIAFPIWCLLFVVWKFGRKKGEQSLSWKQFMAIVFLAIYTINMGYFFDGSFRLIKDYQFISGTLTGTKMENGSPIKQSNRFKNSWIGYLPVPLPAEFVQGIDTQKLDFERGIESYARGVWSDHGWWWYYCYVLLLKEPLGVWALTILALAASVFFRDINASWRDELTVLLPLLAIFTFLSSQDGFSIHPRYVILVLPFLYIWVVKLAQTFALRKRLLAIMTAMCLVWIVGSSLWFYPHSMSHFNELAGGPKNWPKCLLGSNIDWGQDAYELKNWVEKHPEARPLYISIEPAIPLKKLGIECEGEIPAEPTEGWVVIGVTNLYERKMRYEWLHVFEPIQILGKSIYIYRVNYRIKNYD
ncbi:MAG: ArnT family glycosyltransferase [Thermoguttaceae bacterium]